VRLSRKQPHQTPPRLGFPGPKPCYPPRSRPTELVYLSIIRIGSHGCASRRMPTVSSCPESASGGPRRHFLRLRSAVPDRDAVAGRQIPRFHAPRCFRRRDVAQPARWSNGGHRRHTRRRSVGACRRSQVPFLNNSAHRAPACSGAPAGPNVVEQTQASVGIHRSRSPKKSLTEGRKATKDCSQTTPVCLPGPPSSLPKGDSSANPTRPKRARG